MVQNLSQSEEQLAKLETRFMNLHAKHEQLSSDFGEQTSALTREKKAREDAQECEAQVRILLEDEADKKGTTRDQLRRAEAEIKRLQEELDGERRAHGMARSDYNSAMDELDLERTAHGGSKAHLAHTSGSLQTMQTIEGALRAEIASARAQIESLTQEKNELIYTTDQLREKVVGIVAWLNRGQRIEKQAADDSNDGGGLDTFLASASPRQSQSPRGVQASGSNQSLGSQIPAVPASPKGPQASPGGKVRVFKHSANLVEVERTGLLRELQTVLSLLDVTFRRYEHSDQGPSNEEILELERLAEDAQKKADAEMAAEIVSQTQSLTPSIPLIHP